MRKVKIVVTIGPSTDDRKTIKKLIQKGVNVFRLNFSHATHEYHQDVYNKIRQASKELGKEVAILQDISGPKVRISHLEKPIKLKYKDILTLSKETFEPENKVITLSYPQIIDSLKVGKLIYFADGTIRAKIVQKNDDNVKCEILVPEDLHSKKGVNFPNSELNLQAITKKDIDDLQFGAKLGVDIVALSFVSDAKDILLAKEILQEENANPFVFAKIEKQEAVTNIKKILEVADGIMVARGDMGVELGVQKVPVIQKKIIALANKMGKLTITATQMLTSMINSPYPTRAEISDIANAVLDESDAVMLSDETTVGKYPLKAVKVLHQSIMEAQTLYPYYKKSKNIDTKDSIAAAVTILAKSMNPDALISFSKTGRSAMSLASFRPKQKILVNSYDISILRKLQIVWGIDSIVLLEKSDDEEKLLKQFLQKAIEEKYISISKKYIVTIGSYLISNNKTNDIKVLDKDTISYILKYNFKTR